jgi:hypothetical protein
LTLEGAAAFVEALVEAFGAGDGFGVVAGHLGLERGEERGEKREENGRRCELRESGGGQRGVSYIGSESGEGGAFSDWGV